MLELQNLLLTTCVLARVYVAENFKFEIIFSQSTPMWGFCESEQKEGLHDAVRTYTNTILSCPLVSLLYGTAQYRE